MGFAAGHNRNLAKILGDAIPDFIWLLNNDCLIDFQCISELLTCARNRTEVGIWGATLL
jgi:GT2 family glycosyltransferase